MTGQVISAFGIHVMGDFQALAGLGADWTPDNALMVQDVGNPMLYTLVADIPAFAKYEYKFVNGDQSYEVEIVPDKARVGYNNVDNRWIYIDSLANDTTMLPEFVFSQTSPAGYTMMRYLVDMTLQTVAPEGVHIAGDFQTWDPATHRLYSFGYNTYEIIVYGSATNTYNYKFYNGNTIAAAENVPASCAIATNREMQLTLDTIATKVCFSSCTTCYPLAVTENNTDNDQLYPNPMHDVANLVFNDNSKQHQVMLSDLSGRIILNRDNIIENNITIIREGLQAGIYLLSVKNDKGNTRTYKLSVE